MAVFHKFNSGAQALAEGINSGSDDWRIILSNVAPNVAAVKQADAAELPTAGGYVAGGNACAIVSSAQGAGAYKLTLASPAPWTGLGAGFVLRYAILWSQTADRLVGWWDYSAPLHVASGETFLVELPPGGILSLS